MIGRYFLAVEPDEPARVKLARVLSDATAALGDAADAFRWVQAKNIHITLHFLGNVESARVGQLTELLAPGLREAPFITSTGSLGRFPSAGPPKVLWLGIDAGAAQLGRIYEQLAVAIKRVGLSVEDRPFTPHVTLARARDRERSRVRRILWPQSIQSDRIEWRVTHATLMQSDLSGPAPEYRPAASIGLSLGGADYNTV